MVEYRTKISLHRIIVSQGKVSGGEKSVVFHLSFLKTWYLPNHLQDKLNGEQFNSKRRQKLNNICGKRSFLNFRWRSFCFDQLFFTNHYLIWKKKDFWPQILNYLKLVKLMHMHNVFLLCSEKVQKLSMQWLKLSVQLCSHKPEYICNINSVGKKYMMNISIDISGTQSLMIIDQHLYIGWNCAHRP